MKMTFFENGSRISLKKEQIPFKSYSKKIVALESHKKSTNNKIPKFIPIVTLDVFWMEFR